MKDEVGDFERCGASSGGSGGSDIPALRLKYIITLIIDNHPLLAPF